MNDLDERARALIDTAKSQGGLTPERRARLTRSISAATAAGAALAATSSATAATPAAAAVIKLGVVGLVAMGVGVAGTWTVSRLVSRSPQATAPGSQGSTWAPRGAPAPSAEPEANRAAQVVAPSDDERTRAPLTQTPTPAPKPSAAASPARERPAPAAVTPALDESTPADPKPPARLVEEDSTAEEVRALSQATEALRTRDFEHALTFARGARVRFPRGVLHAELTLVEVDALCGLQRVDEARSLADTLTVAERTALVIDRLGRSCAAAGAR